MLLSICIPLHPSRTLSNLEDLLASVAGRPSTEILLGLWHASLHPKAPLMALCNKFGARLIETPSVHVTHVRNRLVQAAIGTYILFLDDDVVAKANLIDIAKQYAAKANGLIYQGEPCLGYDRQNLLSRFEEELYKGRFATTVKATLDCDYIDPRNLLISRSVIAHIGFDETLLHAGEGKEMATKLKESKYVIKYSPNLVVYHKHRTTVAEIFVQKWIHGKGKAQRLSRRAGDSENLLTSIARTMFKRHGQAVTSDAWSFAFAIRVYDLLTRLVYVASYAYHRVLWRCLNNKAESLRRHYGEDSSEHNNTEKVA